MAAPPPGHSAMIRLSHRSREHELLDGERLDPRDLRRNLREMALLNRLPGGTGQSLRAIRLLLDGQTSPTVLDVGTGSADLPRRLLEAVPALRVIAADIRPEVLALARAWSRGVDRLTLIEADARSLPVADGSVDVVHSSLVLHHLDPPDAVLALREMRRVARAGVVVNDLRRGLIPYLVTAVTVLALARGRYTRNDGVVSARRAYTLSELDALAAESGMRVAWRSSASLPRVVTAYR
jgi:SAM-dependent methyltransferase